MKTQTEFEKLFVQDPVARLRNTKQYVIQSSNSAEKFYEIHENWPKYWWGVSNAWLVFVGPSPGNSRSNPINWQTEKYPTIGKPHPHFINRIDSTGFWPRIRQWTTNSFKIAEIFYDETSSLSMVLLANVLDTREGDSAKLLTKSLLEKIPSTVDNLSLVRPCVIVPMEKRVSKMLLNEFKNRGYQVKKGPIIHKVRAKNQKRFTYYKPQSWLMATEWGEVLIAESPQHPSKKNFYNPKVVDKYLADRIKEYLSRMA